MSHIETRFFLRYEVVCRKQMYQKYWTSKNPNVNILMRSLQEPRANMVLNIKHQTAYSQSLVEFVLLVFFNFLYCVVFVFSRLSIVDCPFGFLSFLFCVLFVFVMCAVFPVSLDCPLLIVPSVFLAFYIVFCLFSSCVLCLQFLQIVHC